MQSPEAQEFVFVGGKIRFVFLVRRSGCWPHKYATACPGFLTVFPNGLVFQSGQSGQHPGHTHARQLMLSCLLFSPVAGDDSLRCATDLPGLR